MSHLLTTFLNSSLASTHRSTRASLRILSLPWNPVLRHFISPHISFAPRISFTLITITFTIQIAADRSLRRPPHTQQSRSQTLAQTLTRHSSAHRSPYKPPHTSQFRSQIRSIFFFNAYLGFRAWAPGTLHHENFHNDFQVGCIIEAAGFCGWWQKIVILISKLQISHGRLPLFGARKSGGNLWFSQCFSILMDHSNNVVVSLVPQKFQTTSYNTDFPQISFRHG